MKTYIKMNVRPIVTIGSALLLSLSAHAERKFLMSEAEFDKRVQAAVDKAIGKNKYARTAVTGAKVIESGHGKLMVGHDYVRGGSGENAKKQVDPKVIKAMLDRPIVTDAASFALGTGEQAPEMSSVRKFGSAVLHGVNPRGKLQTGWAASMNLGAAYDEIRWARLPDEERERREKEEKLDDEMWDKEDGLGSFFHRQLHRTVLSLATAKADNEKDVNLAIGLSTTFYQHYDEDLSAGEKPRTDGESEPQRLFRSLGFKEDRVPDSEFLRALAARRIRSGVTGGIAPILSSTTGKFGDLSYNGYTAYLGTSWSAQWSEVKKSLGLLGDGEKEIDPANQYSLGFSVFTKLRAAETWNTPAVAKTATTAAVGARNGEQDTLSVAARVSYGSPKGTFGLEGGYVMLKDGPSGDENAWQIGGNLSVRVYQDVFFVLNVGEKLGGDGEFFSVGGFQIGASEK